MNKSLILPALFFSAQAISGSGNLTIATLPGSAAVDLPVCYDQATGKLGNCSEELTFQDITAISVVCPGDKIQDAIDNAPISGWIQLNITGTCQEDVSIRRSHTILDGGGSAKIQGQTAGNAAVGVYGGANNVSIQNISIYDGAGRGVESKSGSSVKLENSTIQNNAGAAVSVAYRSYLHIAGGNTISGGSHNGVAAGLGSVILINGATNTITSAGPPGSDIYAIVAHKTSSIRIKDTQTISNSASPERGYAIAMYHGSTLRQDNGFATITGDLVAYNLSSLMIRDADIIGDASIGFWSTMRFRDEEGDGDSMLTGTIYANGGGGVDFKSSFKMNGDVDCTGGGFASGSPTFVSGSKVGC